MAIGGKRDSDEAMSEINVTPLVDVMLVLLIIFMIVAPKLTSGMKVNLPKVETAPVKVGAEEVIVTIDAKGIVYVGKQPVELDSLGPILKERMVRRGKNMVYLKADENVRYGRVAQVMGRIKADGIAGVGIITEPPKEERKSRR